MPPLKCGDQARADGPPPEETRVHQAAELWHCQEAWHRAGGRAGCVSVHWRVARGTARSISKNLIVWSSDAETSSGA